VYLHREPQVHLICNWCMKICLRRTAHISAERLVSEWLISLQTDEQTEIDMATNMGVDIGDKSVYTYVPSGHKRSENQQVLEASNYFGTKIVDCI
jgi:predicted adenine nucleotide alpha hydrolase (AANH) superfamily ATPase